MSIVPHEGPSAPGRLVFSRGGPSAGRLVAKDRCLEVEPRTRVGLRPAGEEVANDEESSPRSTRSVRPWRSGPRRGGAGARRPGIESLDPCPGGGLPTDDDLHD